MSEPRLTVTRSDRSRFVRPALTAFATLVATALGRTAGAAAAPDTPGWQIAIALLAGSAAGAAVLAIGAAPMALGPPRWRRVLAWLLAGAALDLALNRPLQPEWIEAYATAPTAALAAALVAASVFEEVFFRGLLQTALGSTRVLSIGLPAVLFALAHGATDARGFAEVLASGLLLGAARAHTGSVWGSVGPHVAGNLWVLVRLSL